MITKEEYIFLKQLMNNHLDKLDIAEIDKETTYYRQQLKIYEKLVHLSKETDVD